MRPIWKLLVLFILMCTAALIIDEQAHGHTLAPGACTRHAERTPDRVGYGDREQVRECRKFIRLHAAAHKREQQIKNCKRLPGYRRENKCIIRLVFGRYGDEAVRVAQCESGLSTRAKNGQYRGVFQLGSSERATYGHGKSAYAQSVAAYKYFVASGRDWSPWTCKP